MSNRLVFSTTKSPPGLYISRPGYDVLTTTSSNMLFSMDSVMTRVLTSGSIHFELGYTGTKTVNITGTNGVVPMVKFFEVFPSAAGTLASNPVIRFLNYQVTSSNISVTMSESNSTEMYVYFIVFVEN